MSNLRFQTREELLTSIASGRTPAHEAIIWLDALKPAAPPVLAQPVSEIEEVKSGRQSIPWFQIRILT